MFKVLFLMILSFSAMASDEWTTTDTQREAVYLTLHAIDWRQTMDIAHHSDIKEANPILGANPKNSTIHAYMIGSALLQYAIAANLPSEYRKTFQYITIGDSASSVINNFSIGLKISF